VPSGSREDHVHHVDIESGACSCEDHAYRGATCAHYYSALVFLARRNCRADSPRRRSRCERLAPSGRSAA
jgi:hypothetical protein